MQMPCSATQPTPDSRTTKLRINKDIVQRTFGLRVRFISDGNKSHKTINKCFMFTITRVSSYTWTIFHAVTLVCFELLAFFLSLSFSPFSLPFGFFPPPFCLFLIPRFRPHYVSFFHPVKPVELPFGIRKTLHSYSNPGGGCPHWGL